MPPSFPERIEDARRRFRQDVADQLRRVAELAGLPGTVTVDWERAVLRFDEEFFDGPALRLVAIFGDDGETGESVSLCVEADGSRTTLLSLGWRDHPGLSDEETLERRVAELESRTDERFPLEARGVNATADVRTGPYAGGDAIKKLAGALKRAAAQASGVLERPLGLISVERPVQIPTGASPRTDLLEAHAETAGTAIPAQDIELQIANVSELAISALIQAMQRDLAEAESHFVRPGAATSARASFGRAMEWGMVVTAYGVEARTNQIAVASFLGSDTASWLYGLVGPVLIGGLASVSRSKAGKGAAYGLMASWAMAMATIAASQQDFLGRAQGFFPKQGDVLRYEEAVGAARVTKEAADAELKRLNAPVKEPSELLANAKKRWQAEEMKRLARREAELRAKDRERASSIVIEAGVALNKEELHLRDAMLNDPSRAWAWWTLFSIFALINLAGPLAISRVLERWRADHTEAQVSARDRHQKKSLMASLRSGRSTQKAHGMLLLPAVLGRLRREGVSPEVIARLDLGDISQKAAERFDRGVTGTRTRRRLFGPRGPEDGQA